MTTHHSQVSVANKGTLTRLLWFTGGMFIALIGVIVAYAPLIPFFYGVLSLLIATVFFAQASPSWAAKLKTLPGVGPHVVACLKGGISKELEQFFILLTLRCMTCMLFVAKDTQAVLLGYGATIPFIMVVSYLWNKKLRS